MTAPIRPLPRRFPWAALLFLAGLSVPLLGPSCGDFQPGVKTFAKKSLIIPMDVCYQCTRQSADGLDSATANCTATGYRSPISSTPCPQRLALGDVMKAYGLVYELIRHDVAVYWIIDPAKQALDAWDLSIQFGGGFPVQRYDWATGGLGTAPTSDTIVHYMGGPFVIDGSDFDRASAVLQAFKTTFSPVQVHVSNVAFQANVAKTMAGGWSAGGAIPPKLALLDIGSGNITSLSPLTLTSSKNAEPVIEAYLAKAGIGSGAAAGSAAGPHGEIYDTLGIADFQPAAGSTDPRTSRLFTQGYEILWVPHWVAPGSCSNFSSNSNCAATQYPDAQVEQVLKSIGAFVADGRDLFAECAGLGSFEGVRTSGGAWTIDYEDGADDLSSRFQTPAPAATGGMRINQRSPGTPYFPGNFASPLLQLGDFPFRPYDGAIKIYRPYSDYVTATPPLTRLTLDNTDRTLDYFTLLPASAGRGTVVYLAGHSYSGVQGSFQVAGSRLVLNTLFNLGATCTTSGVTCDTGQLGACARGVLTCSNDQPVCAQTVTPLPEVCNGLDDDCDGSVDEGLEQGCYDGPAGTEGVGLCHGGVRTCVQLPGGSYGYSACTGQALPASEVCNGLDDDCDGSVDESLAQACYFGPSNTVDPVSGLPYGVCQRGTQSCVAGSWGDCVGQVLPSPEVCESPESGGGTADDDNCDGVINENCTCIDGQQQDCYSGPAGTAGVGPCRAGTRTCLGSAWSACVGEVLPTAEVCRNGVDENCNGGADDQPPICTDCNSGETLDCWTGPPAARGRGVCQDGLQQCVEGQFAACGGQVLPGAEICNGKDDDCNGLVDDGASCGPGFACENGVCVFSTCAPEIPCREGYDCVGGTCKLAACGSGAPCPPGQACTFGACVDPCAAITCGTGASCAGGFCTGGACYADGCPAGQVCRVGACVANPCADVTCPSGTFCREGDCVQACAFVTCAAGQRCDLDGFCVSDSCEGKLCSPSQVCLDGTCQADPCLGIACGTGQVCQEGTCVDDPCSGIACPTGQCLKGQCYAASNPSGIGTGQADGGGCGCGSGQASPLALLGLLAALPLARRRRRGGGAAALALVLAAGLGLVGTGCSSSSEPFDPLSCALRDPPLDACEGTTRCVDVLSDPSHCGICGQACGAGNTCVDGICGPASAVAPLVRAVSPASAPVGGLAPVALTLTGERFQPGATLRASFGGQTTTVAAQVTDPGRLTASLDLTEAATGTWSLRVVNPDRVISNAALFGVVVPTPVLSAVTPSTVEAGAVRTVRLTGSGFMVTSACKISSALVPEQAVPATLGPDGLDCAIDLTRLQPGSYQVWVVNQGPLSSAKLPLTVQSATPVLSSVSPSSARSNTIVTLSAFGQGFDVTSQLVFRRTDTAAELALATTLVDSTRLYVAQLDLSRCPGTAAPCPDTTAAIRYELVVRNQGGRQSAARPFLVQANPPAVSGLSPQTAWQGDTVTVTFTGQDLPAGTVVEARTPGGAFAALAPTGTPGATSVSAILDLVGAPPGSMPEGEYDLRLGFTADGTVSASYPFRVLSNTAVVTGTPTPSSGTQGGSAAVTVPVSNIRPPTGQVRVRFAGSATDLTPSSVGGSTLNVVLPLAGLNAGGYALSVVNPNGARPSNAVTFSVVPGLPTVTGVACTSLKPGGLCETATSAVRQVTPVPLRITGTNFAQPDVAGNNGSVVHVSSAALGIVDYPLPTAATTVVSATQMEVALDTTLAVPGTYAFAVWNPGGPLKSNVLQGAFTILP